LAGVGAGGSHSPADPAPHCRRRLVHGRPLPGAVDPLCGLRHRPSVATPRAPPPVRGLCDLAAPMAAGRSARKPALILETAADWTAGLRVAHRPPTPGGPELPRRQPRDGALA